MAARVNLQGPRVTIGSSNYPNARPVVGDCCPCDAGGGQDCTVPPGGFCPLTMPSIPPPPAGASNCYNVVTLTGTNSGNSFVPFGYSRDFAFLGGLPHYVEAVRATCDPQQEDKDTFTASFTVGGWKIFKRGESTGACYSASGFTFDFGAFSAEIGLQALAEPVDPLGTGVAVGDPMEILHIQVSGDPPAFFAPDAILTFTGTATWLPDDRVNIQVQVNGTLVWNQVYEDGFRCAKGNMSAGFGQFTPCGSTPPGPTADIFLEPANFNGAQFN